MLINGRVWSEVSVNTCTECARKRDQRQWKHSAKRKEAQAWKREVMEES